MIPNEVFWHDLEHSGYVADLPIWLKISKSVQGRTVELGCGTGRVTNFLGSSGVLVTGIDREPNLLAALAARRVPGSRVEACCSDILLESKPPSASVFIAPAMFFQTVGPEASRIALFSRLKEGFEIGGLLAISVVEGLRAFSAEELSTVPACTVNCNGTTYQSRVAAMREAGGAFEMVRERSANGELVDTSTETLSSWSISAASKEAESAGLRLAITSTVRATGRHGPMSVLVFHAN